MIENLLKSIKKTDKCQPTPFAILSVWLISVILHSETNNIMNQKEAIIAALEKLGGRASLNDIYTIAYPLADWSGSNNWKATLRWYLQKDAASFRSPKRGWWELVSYQEEVSALRQKIADLKAQLAEKDKVIEELRKVPTEDAFVKKLIKATKTLFRFKRNEADAIRQVMDKLGRSDADADLTAWMEGRERKPSISIDKLEIRQGGTNIDTNYGPNIEHSGGTLSLPDGIVATPLPESDDKK